MSEIEQILQKTNGGRDLIVECYPVFSGIKDDMMAKLRSDEKVPSAHIHKVNDRYILKDFGDSKKGMDGISVFAQTHGMSREEAIKQLAKRYCDNDVRHSPIGPTFDTRPLSGTMKQGERKYEYKQSFTPEELRLLAPKATEADVTSLGWHSVAQTIVCKDDKEIVIKSTPSYPIFARDLHDSTTGDIIGHKIYQPRYQSKGDGKNFKFSYSPSGMQLGSYVHGLYELERDKKEGNKQVDVIICSGERDAIVAKSMGYAPIWFNSETKEIPSDIITKLKELANRIYYIPDIDATGRNMGMANIKRFPELICVWLPEDMKQRKGDQHKPCKDLRDWAETHRSKKEFANLLNTGKRYQFWDFTDKGKPFLVPDSLLYFLNINGFWRMKNSVTDEYEFIHIDGHIVKQVSPEDIRRFVVEWAANLPPFVRDLIYKGRKNAIEQYKDLAVIDIDFKSATTNSQAFCFQNKQIMVTDESIYEIDKDSEVFFLEKKVIKHDITLLPPMFEYEEYTDSKGMRSFSILPRTDKCKLFHVLIRTSMIHWQKTESSELTEAEEMEENKSLAAKMFAIGHLTHRHREKTRDWAPMLTDNNTDIESKVAEGGSAKSFLFTDVLPNCGYEVVKYVSKKKNPLEDDFMLDQVTPSTDVFYVDECPDRFEFDKLNAYITDSFIVNKKNKSRFTIPYKQAPKISFITNHAIHDFGGSAARRHMYLTYSDYFHYASPTNGFTFSRTIRDEIGMVLMGDDYPEEDWNRDLNFILQCEQFYLHAVSVLNDKITPELDDILRRHNSTEYTEAFDGWATNYFDNPSHLNCSIVIDLMVNDYNKDHFPHIEKNELKRQLKAWVACQEGMEFNPLEKCNEKKCRRIKCTFQGKNSEKIHIACSPKSIPV